MFYTTFGTNLTSTENNFKLLTYVILLLSMGLFTVTNRNIIQT